MELTGKIIAVLGERGGTSARTGSEWKVASYVLETVGEQYPRKMCFEVFGVDRIKSLNIQPNETLKVKFDIDAHEYNGRWFNSIRAYAIDRNLEASSPVVTSAVPGGVPFTNPPVPPAKEDSIAEEDSELPF